jgi:hypothetical protein
MTSQVKEAKWLRYDPTVVGAGFESGKNFKIFEKNGKIQFSPISHCYYIYQTSYTFTKQKRSMVKVYQHYHVYLVRNPHTERRKTGKGNTQSTEVVGD